MAQRPKKEEGAVMPADKSTKVANATDADDAVEMGGFLATARGLPAAEIAALWAVRKDMLAYQREQQAEENRLAYFSAKAAMQAEMPIVPRNKPNPNTGKNYSPLEQVVRLCAPVWSRFGFSIGFDVITLDNGWLQVICKVTHAMGFQEIFTNPPAPPDDRGIKGNINKTLVQGNQATITYAKRGVLCNAMGIVTEDEDDDGNIGQRSSPHEGHTAPTPSREREVRGPTAEQWVSVTMDKLTRDIAQAQFFKVLHDSLPACPNATAIVMLWKSLMKGPLKNAPKNVQDDVHSTLKKRSALFDPNPGDDGDDPQSGVGADPGPRDRDGDGGTEAGHNDSAEDGGEYIPRGEAASVPLSPEEQWAAKTLTAIANCHEASSLLLMMKDKRTIQTMSSLKQSHGALFTKMDAAFSARLEVLRTGNKPTKRQPTPEERMGA